MRLMLDRFGRIVIPKSIRDEFQLRPGDELEFIAVVHESQGRLVYNQLRRIEFTERGQGNAPWREEEIPFLLKTATEFRVQPEKCLYCPYGTLVDVFEEGERGNSRYRRLFCLKGVHDPAACVIQPLKQLASEGCPEEVNEVPWKEAYR